MVKVSAAVNFVANEVSSEFTDITLAYTANILVVSVASNLSFTLAELAEYRAKGTAPKLVVPISTNSLEYSQLSPALNGVIAIFKFK